MVKQATRGIKISVKTKYQGASYRNGQILHNFSYFITIENTSEISVQLTRRYWKIFDSLNATEIVEGPGVVGQTPTLKPKDIYTYQSYCCLLSSMGSMSGYYSMTNLENNVTFRVIIPTFQLLTKALLN